MFRTPCVKVLNKKIPVYKRGYGGIPLLVVGQASLFQKPNMLPAGMERYFTIYFVDVFAKSKDETMADYSALTLNDFVDSIESIRIQLGLKKIALIGHSAAGILAFEYAMKYKKNTSFIIVVSTAPIWGDYKDKLVAGYFDHNSTSKRRDLFQSDQKALMSDAESKESQVSSQPFFIRRYHSRRAHFYREPANVYWQHIWDGVNMDELLVQRYFETIKNYDIRNTSYKDISSLLILGLYDYSSPFYGWTDEARAKLDNMEYFIFTNSGHYPMIEEADLFMEKIRDFVNRSTSTLMLSRL